MDQSLRTCWMIPGGISQSGRSYTFNLPKEMYKCQVWIVLQRWGYSNALTHNKRKTSPWEAWDLRCIKEKGAKKNVSGWISGVPQVGREGCPPGPAQGSAPSVAAARSSPAGWWAMGSRDELLHLCSVVLACSWQDRGAEQLLDSSLCSCSYLGVSGLVWLQGAWKSLEGHQNWQPITAVKELGQI